MIVICEQITNCLHFMIFFYILNFIYTNKPIYHLQNTKPRNMLVSFFKSYCFEVLSATALKIPQTYHKSKVVGLLDFFIDIFFLSLKFRIKKFFLKHVQYQSNCCVSVWQNSAF